VIVGGGMAAVRLAERLVAEGVSDLTVVGDEPHAPYNRILLSAVLEGTHRPEAITLRRRNWFAAHGVDLRLGTRVVDLHRDRRVIELADGGEVAYDRLVLATGAVPSLPPIRGLVGADGTLDPRVHAFRGLDDCIRLLGAVPQARSAIVIGGGLLGLQVARAISVRGLRTEIVEGAPTLLHSYVDEVAGAVLRRSLARLGTEVYTGARAVRLTEAGLQLDNGFALDADLFVLTAGGRPNVNLARRAGLEVRSGIVVDETLTTSDPLISAIGDCAQLDGEGGGVTGFVAPAWAQAGVLADGAIAAATLVGDLTQVGHLTQAFDRGTRLAPGEPAALISPSPAANGGASAVVQLPDEAEICACAGVSAGRIRACRSLDDVREQTRATTGCGGCTATVSSLLPALVNGAV